MSETAAGPRSTGADEDPAGPPRAVAAVAAALRGAAVAWPYLLAAAIAGTVAAWAYRPWAFGSALLHPQGDALAFAAWVQNTIETGWYEHGPRLAAPFAQNSHSYTLTDELLMALVGKVLAPLTGGPGPAIAWWLMLCMPITAAAGVGLARYLGTSRVAALVPGIAFAILPDTFMRATGHYGLATTWTVPIGVLAAVSLVHRPAHTGRARIVWEVALGAGLVAVTLTNAYYAVFSGILVAAAGLGAYWTRRELRDLALTALRGATLVVPLVIAVLVDRRFVPSPLGFEAFAVTRSPADAEYYAGKIIAMLLPAPGHRFDVLADIRLRYDTAFPPPAEGPALGLVAAVGFVALVAWATLSHWRPRGLTDHPVHATLAGLTWVALFAYVVGGLGTLWAILLDGGGIRVWSRMHVVIALLALLAVGLVLDRLVRHWRVAAVVLLVAVAVVDQPRPGYRPSPPAAVAVQAEVTDLTARIAADAGAQAMVFQLPILTFPVQNRTTGTASAYDGFLPYLYSDGLDWSYGGLQGDIAADWQLELLERPLDEQVALLEAAGFAGILVDTAALADTPGELTQIADLLGAPDIASASGRWLYFAASSDPGDCSPAAADLTADLAVRPALLYGGTGFAKVPGAWTSPQGDASLRVLTLRTEGWDAVTTSFTVQNPTTRVRLTFPDGSTQELAPGERDVHWTGAVTGTSTIEVTRLDAAPGGVAVSGLDADVVTPPAAAACLATLGGGG